jgi:hypothetical protein
MLFPYAFIYGFFVYGLIYWCLRLRGTTPIHPELGGVSNLVVKLYCERGALLKNSLTLG